MWGQTGEKQKKGERFRFFAESKETGQIDESSNLITGLRQWLREIISAGK
jgi:hypothetical protein